MCECATSTCLVGETYLVDLILTTLSIPHGFDTQIRIMKEINSLPELCIYNLNFLEH